MKTQAAGVLLLTHSHRDARRIKEEEGEGVLTDSRDDTRCRKSRCRRHTQAGRYAGTRNPLVERHSLPRGPVSRPCQKRYVTTCVIFTCKSVKSSRSL